MVGARPEGRQTSPPGSRGGDSSRGFSGRGAPGSVGGRRNGRPRAAAGGLALYLLAGALACAQDVAQPLDAPRRLTLTWLRAGQCRRPRHPDADAARDHHRRPSPDRPQDLDAARQRARDRTRATSASSTGRRSCCAANRKFSSPGSARAGSRRSRAISRSSPIRRCLRGCWIQRLARAARCGEDRGGDGAAPDPRRSFRRRRGQPSRAPSRTRRAPGAGSAVMRIRDVSGERLQLAKLRDQFAQAEGALDGLAARPRTRRHAGMDARRCREDRLVQ